MATGPSRKGKVGALLTADRLAEMKRDLFLLAQHEVLVGFPQDTTERDAAGAEPEGITNAALGYIHDNGEPDANIPARPFMIPGIEAVEDKVADKLVQGAKAVVRPVAPPNIVERVFHSVGLIVANSIKQKINEGPPPPLSPYTLRQRAKKGDKLAQLELDNRSRGEAPSTELAKPLVDTAQMRNAVTYVIRDRKKRGR
jgi:hypothetical protein